MPTDIPVAARLRHSERLSTAYEETVLVILPAVFGILAAAMSIQNPAFAAIIISGAQQ